MRTIIKQGTVVTEAEHFQADVLIEAGKVKALGGGFEETGAQVIEAAGLYVLPGAVDVHTHISLQAGACHTTDDFFTGTRSAACGGTTSVIEHLAFGPKGCSLRYQIEQYKKAAAGKAVIDYGLHGVIQEVTEDTLREMEELAREGIQSFKIYLTYNFAIPDAGCLRVFQKAKELNTPIAVHCENDSLVNYNRARLISEGKTAPKYHALSRPNEVEAEAVDRMLHIAHLAGDAPLYIVHLSARESLQVVREARARGQKNIYVETCPQYLLLTDEVYEREDGLKFIMSPPLRKAKDCQALWEGLADGTVDVVATDYCPFYYKTDKQLGKDDFTKCPNGGTGIEERVMALFSEGVMQGRITIEQFVKLLCTNPARIYGAYPQKGTLQPGADGDVMLIDPRGSGELTVKNLHGVVDYSCYEGLKLQGALKLVLSKGELVCREGRFTGKAGAGKFLVRQVQPK
jgi:dihydropyrimidinase